MTEILSKLMVLMTDDEVDALPTAIYANTKKRLRARFEWGMRAGLAAFERGDDVNAFWDRPKMTMHRGWEAGYETAQLEQEALTTDNK